MRENQKGINQNDEDRIGFSDNLTNMCSDDVDVEKLLTEIHEAIRVTESSSSSSTHNVETQENIPSMIIDQISTRVSPRLEAVSQINSDHVPALDLEEMNQNSQVGKNAPINVHHHSMSATFNVNLEFKSNTEINQQNKNEKKLVKNDLLAEAIAQAELPLDGYSETSKQIGNRSNTETLQNRQGLNFNVNSDSDKNESVDIHDADAFFNPETSLGSNTDNTVINRQVKKTQKRKKPSEDKLAKRSEMVAKRNKISLKREEFLSASCNHTGIYVKYTLQNVDQYQIAKIIHQIRNYGTNEENNDDNLSWNELVQIVQTWEGNVGILGCHELQIDEFEFRIYPVLYYNPKPGNRSYTTTDVAVTNATTKTPLMQQNQEKKSQACELPNCKTVTSGENFRKNFRKHFLEHFFTVANTPCAYCGLMEKRMDNHGKKIPHCQTKQMNSGIYGDSIGSDWIPLSKVVSR